MIFIFLLSKYFNAGLSTIVVRGGQQKYTFLFDDKTPVEKRCFSGRQKSCDVTTIVLHKLWISE